MVTHYKCVESIKFREGVLRECRISKVGEDRYNVYGRVMLQGGWWGYVLRNGVELYDYPDEIEVVTGGQVLGLKEYYEYLGLKEREQLSVYMQEVEEILGFREQSLWCYSDDEGVYGVYKPDSKACILEVKGGLAGYRKAVSYWGFKFIDLIDMRGLGEDIQELSEWELERGGYAVVYVVSNDVKVARKGWIIQDYEGLRFLSYGGLTVADEKYRKWLIERYESARSKSR